MIGITRSRMVLLLLGVSLALAGCSGGDGDAGADAGGSEGSAATSGGSSSSGEAGEAEGYEEVEIDFAYPTDVAPPYPDARVVASRTDKLASTLTVHTEDMPKDVAAFYESRFTNWDQPLRDMQARLSTLAFTSPSGRSVSILINRDPYKNITIVSVTVAKR